MVIRPSILCVLIPFLGFTQTKNLIPNPGFEQIQNKPEVWFYTGSDFNLVFSDWKSPTAASPDVYHDQIHVPTYWKEKGFYQLRPYHGHSMVGLTLYGCNLGKLHCREYVSVPLTEPLIIGQQYYFSMWVAPMQKGVLVDQIQIAFDQQPAVVMDDRRLELKPFYDLTLINQEDWQRVELRFYAETEARYFTVGNFKDDATTAILRSQQSGHQPFAYYYLDEVNLRKIPPILSREEIGTYDSLNLAQSTIELKNIYFDFDETKLLPTSYLELNKLLKLLKAFPALNIHIIGHTDKIGSVEYNKILSTSRANTVASFLTRHYIDPTRLKVTGVGYDQPIASNEDESGRQKNRRVVFEILK